MKTTKLELIRCDSHDTKGRECNHLLLKVMGGKIEVFCPHCKERHLIPLDRLLNTE